MEPGTSSTGSSATRRIPARTSVVLAAVTLLLAPSLVQPATANDWENWAILVDAGLQGDYDSTTEELTVTWTNPDPACLGRKNAYGTVINELLVGFELWHEPDQTHLNDKVVKKDAASAALKEGESSWTGIVDSEGKPSLLVQLRWVPLDDWQGDFYDGKPGPCQKKYNWKGHGNTTTHQVFSWAESIPVAPDPPTKDIVDIDADGDEKRVKEAVKEVARAVRTYHAILAGYDGGYFSTWDCVDTKAKGSPLVNALAATGTQLKTLDRATPPRKKWTKAQKSQLKTLIASALTTEDQLRQIVQTLDSCDLFVAGPPPPEPLPGPTPSSEAPRELR